MTRLRYNTSRLLLKGGISVFRCGLKILPASHPARICGEGRIWQTRQVIVKAAVPPRP